MNREIKFRGKSLVDIGNIKKGDWVFGGIVFDTDRVWIDVAYVGQVLVEKETVGQYTGFHDRFGDEIYESDIVYVRSEDENAIIEWDEQTARFIIHFDGCIADFDNYYGKELEIMGDIYNNPELLGGE